MAYRTIPQLIPTGRGALFAGHARCTPWGGGSNRTNNTVISNNYYGGIYGGYGMGYGMGYGSYDCGYNTGMSTFGKWMLGLGGASMLGGLFCNIFGVGQGNRSQSGRREENGGDARAIAADNIKNANIDGLGFYADDNGKIIYIYTDPETGKKYFGESIQDVIKAAEEEQAAPVTPRKPEAAGAGAGSSEAEEAEEAEEPAGAGSSEADAAAGAETSVITQRPAMNLLRVPSTWERIFNSVRNIDGPSSYNIDGAENKSDVSKCKNIDAVINNFLLNEIRKTNTEFGKINEITDIKKLKDEIIKYNPSIFNADGSIKPNANWQKLDLPTYNYLKENNLISEKADEDVAIAPDLLQKLSFFTRPGVEKSIQKIYDSKLPRETKEDLIKRIKAELERGGNKDNLRNIGIYIDTTIRKYNQQNNQ